MALGAGHSEILRLIIGQGLKLALVGVAIGIVTAALIARVSRSMLFQTDTADPSTFISVSILFLVVSGLAAYLPARRAMRVELLKVLQTD